MPVRGALDPHGHRRVVIAGGGFAALETLVALRTLAGQRIEIDLITPEAQFTNRPLVVAATFGGAGPTLTLDIAWLAAVVGATFIADTVDSIDTDEHTAMLGSGRTHRYDTLVMAPGARAQEAIPGAITFGSARGAEGFKSVLDEAQAGRISAIIFAVPPGSGWPLPLYELAMLTAERLHTAGASAEITLLTPEQAPLAAFGEPASAAVREDLAARGITFRGGVEAQEVAWGELRAEPGKLRLAADAVITLPRLVGPAVPGLPSDELGFIPVDLHGLVDGTTDVYAAGDAINFPIKHGGLATLQADAAAEAIAATVRAAVVPSPFRPVLRGMLLTGGRPRFFEGVAGSGEDTVTASREPLWWPPAKVACRYLAPFLSGQVRSAPASGEGVDVNVEIDEWTRLARTEG